jgi:hypothetical protein
MEMRMPRILRLVLVCICCVAALAQEANVSQIDRKHTEWVASVLKSAQGVKVGMTRADLLLIFSTEGGLSTTSQRTFVHRNCPLIKVDVKFAAASKQEELPQDKIIEISRPYLAWTIAD